MECPLLLGLNLVKGRQFAFVSYGTSERLNHLVPYFAVRDDRQFGERVPRRIVF